MTDEPSAGAFSGREHRLPVRIYYEDTDFTGVVYHASYVRFFERGRTEFLRASGIGHRNLLERADPCAFVVTRLDIAFRKAARIDDALVVRTAYNRVRGPRLWVSQILERGAELIATAAVEVACITLAGAPRRPPADLVELITPLLAET
jgi:acyl-CoA thioester hydrolase